MIRKLTGTTGGESPVLDGTMRGALVALLNAGIGVATASNWLDAAQAAYIALMVNPLVFFLFGVWDSLMKDKDAEIQKALKLLLQAQADGEKAALIDKTFTTAPSARTFGKPTEIKSGDSGTRPIPAANKPIPGRPKTPTKRKR